MKSDLKIIFIGTPEFGAIILEGMIKGKYKPDLVITNPDKPVGRKKTITPSPVKLTAEKYKIPILQKEKIKECEEKIKNLNPGLIVVAAFGEILPREILKIPEHGCLNVHPSLLPKFRGSSPIQFAILNGEKKTGTTIILMDEKMDHGPILNQRSTEIKEVETALELRKKLAQLGSSLLLETITRWTRNLIEPKPQDDGKATFTRALIKEDGRINWQKTAEELEREVRAFSIWPCSFTVWERRDGIKIRIKILKARVYKVKGGIPYSIGKTLVVPQNEIGVQCGTGHFAKGFKGDLLVIEKLQKEGGKEMSAEDFLRGHIDFIGSVLK